MLALFPKVPKIQRPKALKGNVFDYFTVVWRLLSRKPPRISTYLHCKIKVEPMGYIFAAIVWIYLHSNFSPYRLRRTHILCNDVRSGPSRLSKVIGFGTNRKRVCSLINNNFGPILSRLRDITGFYPRDAMLARVFAIATCLSVCLSVTRRYCA